MTILIFFTVLFVLILVHEWGHFIVAKKTGMRVDEFGIGFPPRLFTKKKGETEYTLNAIPIGGFVRILGENGTLSGEDLSEEDKQRTFDARPKWAQALVLVAGVTMNFLFAWLLFTLTFMSGVPTPVDEVNATDQAELYVVGVLPDSPAGDILPVGSVVEEVSYDDTVVVSPTPSEFSAAVESSGDAGVSVTYSNGDNKESVVLTPQVGLLEQDPERKAIGVSLVLVDEERYPVHQALWNALRFTWERTVFIATSLWGLIHDAVIGQPDLSAVAGPVGIVGLVGDAASDGFVALMTFTAMISLSLAVFNLLPFPALDGGRLVFVAIEAITGKKIPPEWAGRVNLIGFALLMLLMIAVTYNDITRLF